MYFSGATLGTLPTVLPRPRPNFPNSAANAAPGTPSTGGGTRSITVLGTNSPTLNGLSCERFQPLRTLRPSVCLSRLTGGALFNTAVRRPTLSRSHPA